MFSHRSLSDLVFNEVSCSRELPQKAIGLNLFTPEELMNNSSPLAFIHLPQRLLPKRTYSYPFNYLFLPNYLFFLSSFPLLHSTPPLIEKTHLSVPPVPSMGFHRGCWLWAPAVTEPAARNRFLPNRPALSPALSSEGILARGISQRCCSCVWIVNLRVKGQQGATQELPLRKHWALK